MKMEKAYTEVEEPEDVCRLRHLGKGVCCSLGLCVSLESPDWELGASRRNQEMSKTLPMSEAVWGHHLKSD